MAPGGGGAAQGFELPNEIVGEQEDIGAPSSFTWDGHNGNNIQLQGHMPRQGHQTSTPRSVMHSDAFGILGGPFSMNNFDSSFGTDRATSAPPNVAELQRSGIMAKGNGAYPQQAAPADVHSEEFYEDFYRNYNNNNNGTTGRAKMPTGPQLTSVNSNSYGDIARMGSAQYDSMAQPGVGARKGVVPDSILSAFNDFGMGGGNKESSQELGAGGGHYGRKLEQQQQPHSQPASPRNLEFQAAYTAALLAQEQHGQMHPHNSQSQQQLEATVAAATAAATAAADHGREMPQLQDPAATAAAAAAAAAAMAATTGQQQQQMNFSQLQAAQMAAMAAAMQYHTGIQGSGTNQQNQVQMQAAVQAAAAAVSGNYNFNTQRSYPAMAMAAAAAAGVHNRSSSMGNLSGRVSNDGSRDGGGGGGFHNGNEDTQGGNGSRRARSSRRRVESSSAIVGDALEIELESGTVSRIVELSELSGRTLAVARDQNGCRFLQRRFDEGGSTAVAEIFEEILPNLITLMTDPFGNYLFQKLVERCNDEQRMRVLREICVGNRLVEVSLNTHGTRAVQKVIEMLTPPEEVELVTSALSVGIVELIKDLNGNHVVQRCLQRLAHVQKQFIYDAACSHCVEIASHRHGCCVLQRCIDYASPEQRNALLTEIASHALELSQDPFGNYVVQYVLELGAPWATENVMKSLRGSYYQLSMQKFSSNVVEKCLKQMDSSLDEQRDYLIQELSESPHLGKLLQDPYANYVIQRVLSMSTGERYTMLVERIRPYASVLKTSPYGKRILAKMPMGAKKGMKQSSSSGDLGSGETPVH